MDFSVLIDLFLCIFFVLFVLRSRRGKADQVPEDCGGCAHEGTGGKVPPAVRGRAPPPLRRAQGQVRKGARAARVVVMGGGDCFIPSQRELHGSDEAREDAEGVQRKYFSLSLTLLSNYQ